MVDKLNSISYAWHYRDIDSTEYYARQALAVPSCRGTQRAEALNNLAFVAMVRMDYDRADSILQEAVAATDNQVELLVAEVQQMRLCQRCSKNREFYEYREKAAESLKRINEERDQLSARNQERLLYAASEMAIVTSTYYYYVGLEEQSIKALETLNTDELRHDTAQYLNYLYNVGAGGILTEGDAAQIHQEEVSYLNRCLSVAKRHGYVYFMAQAKEALAEHAGDMTLAKEALDMFLDYGDVYQIAGAYRTMATCCHALGDDQRALVYLDSALIDNRINQAPDLVASIREQLSVAYSAVDDKQASDYNRNIYIDLQEQTRQDRELEARAGLLDRSVQQLNWMMAAVLAAIVLLVILLWLFNHLNKQRQDNHRFADLLEEKKEELGEASLRVEKNERRNLEQRAKVSLAMGILPLIDRILHAAKNSQDDRMPDGHMEYIRELTANITEQNELLTQWIQLRQGELSLHIESFPLQSLFDMVGRAEASFKMKGITLTVRPTDATVKADRVLTLFMLNTLADNARKFTPSGGNVSIGAESHGDYVEISVTDTGCGLSADALSNVFDHKVRHGHGFGLTNCKGIIEKYRKMSRLFSVCHIGAESQQGCGSRFFFRLPPGVKRCLIAVFVLCPMLLSASGQSPVTLGQSPITSVLPPIADSRSALDLAHIYADSAYFCNVNGTYERTLLFADSCISCLNRCLPANKNFRKMALFSEDGTMPAEIQWLHQNVGTNYQIILDIRNESAVAALALHRWQLYSYNNKAYTQLFKELSADNTLGDYCRTMQQSSQNKRVAVILLIVLFVMIVPAYYLLYYRHRLHSRFRLERQWQADIEQVDDELRRAELENGNLHVANAVLDNCLSALKHETMYYPSRIRQLADSNQLEALKEVASYYRELYGLLIRQAVSLTGRSHLHLRCVELYGQRVLGDDNLLRYLFELLKLNQVTAHPKDDRYVEFTGTLAAAGSAVSTGHSGALGDITYHLCRQIVRDHGEASNRRGCGILVEKEHVIIILPRYHGKV